MCVHVFSCSCADVHLHNTDCKHSHVVQVTSINQPSEVLSNDDSEPLEIKDLVEDQDSYEDLVFLARNNNEDSPHHLLHDEMYASESPNAAEYRIAGNF